jgi:hypothetical protein
VYLDHQQRPPQKESQTSPTYALAIYRRCHYRALSSTSRNVRASAKRINNALTFHQIKVDCDESDQLGSG